MLSEILQLRDYPQRFLDACSHEWKTLAKITEKMNGEPLRNTVSELAVRIIAKESVRMGLIEAKIEGGTPYFRLTEPDPRQIKDDAR